METTKQKPTVNTQKIKEYKHTTKQSHQTTKGEQEKEEQRGTIKNCQKTINKMVISI